MAKTPATPASRKRASAELAAKPATPKRAAAKDAGKPKPAPARTRSTAKPEAAAKPAKAARSTTSKPAPAAETKPARARTAAQREAAFDTLVRNACLKAGTAAAISSLTRRVPLIGRLAPSVLGPLAETVALAQVQKDLVREVIALYEVELSEPEQRGVVLLATATNIGAQQLSKRSMDAILKQFGEGVVRGIAQRVLPMASILAEITASVASTYTVAKRAQALCKLPGTGAGNLADLLRGLSGIDQQRLLSWSGEAFKLALMPFRGALALFWRG
jgi:uncharacterized protein (DUF697 family)